MRFHRRTVCLAATFFTLILGLVAMISFKNAPAVRIALSFRGYSPGLATTAVLDLANTGRLPVEYFGYDPASPLFLVERKDSGTWFPDFSAWCKGTATIQLLQPGERITFQVPIDDLKGEHLWRASVSYRRPSLASRFPVWIRSRFRDRSSTIHSAEVFYRPSMEMVSDPKNGASLAAGELGNADRLSGF